MCRGEKGVERIEGKKGERNTIQQQINNKNIVLFTYQTKHRLSGFLSEVCH